MRSTACLPAAATVKYNVAYAATVLIFFHYIEVVLVSVIHPVESAFPFKRGKKVKPSV